MKSSHSDDYRDESERLSKLPREDQRKIIAQHRAIAADKGVPKPERELAEERANALERHLRRLAKKD